MNALIYKNTALCFWTSRECKYWTRPQRPNYSDPRTQLRKIKAGIGWAEKGSQTPTVSQPKKSLINNCIKAALKLWEPLIDPHKTFDPLLLLAFSRTGANADGDESVTQQLLLLQIIFKKRKNKNAMDTQKNKIFQGQETGVDFFLWIVGHRQLRRCGVKHRPKCWIYRLQVARTNCHNGQSHSTQEARVHV